MKDSPATDDLGIIDELIAMAVAQSDQLKGSVHEVAASNWRLLACDQSWIDVDAIGNGLLILSTEVGPIAPAQSSRRLQELMLKYLGFQADASFSTGASGVHRLQQTLPAAALGPAQLKCSLEGFAIRAKAWRGLVQAPDQETASDEPGLNLRPALRA